MPQIAAGANVSTLTTEGIRDELIHKRAEGVDSKIQELQEFLSEQQPDDDTRHQMALLKMLPNKTWNESDLNDEFHMRVGL